MQMRRKLQRKKGGQSNLFILEPGADISQLLVNPLPLLFLVLAVPYVTDEDGETSHPG